MKVTRQDVLDNNKNSTAFWLKEFAYDLEKEAKNVDYLKDYLNQRQQKKFNSIEEKLADIRTRVGLDLAIKISNEVDNLNHKSSSASCGCESKTTSCSCPIKNASEQLRHSDSDLNTMNNILQYIRDMIKHESNLDQVTVLNRCKNEDGLRYNELENKIDKGKLVSYVNDLLNKKNEGSSHETVKYTPSVPLSEFEADDRIADYYNHAEPNRS